MKPTYVTSDQWSVETREIYKWWYKWLGETKVEERLPEVRAGFGDVTIPFEKWLPDHEWLWDETGIARPWHGEVLKTAAMFKAYCDEGVQDDQLVVVLNLHSSKEDLKNFVEDLLKEHHPAGRGRPELDESTKEYPLASRVKPAFLAQLWNLDVAHKEMLDHNKGLKQKDSAYMPLWKLGVKMKYNLVKKDDPKVMEAIVRKNLKRIETLKANVAKGIFPKYE